MKKEQKREKRRKDKQDKGITLVALVVTIIILLILAGVTLSGALSENGLFKRAKYASETYQLESEREALALSVTDYQMDEFSGEKDSNKLGEELNKRDVTEHSTDWHILKVGDKEYSKEWNFVPKGTNIEGYGSAKHSWLVNYETGEIIELEEGEYTDLSAGDMLAVKDGLIINVDSSMVDNNGPHNKETLEQQLGESVELKGFDSLDEGTADSGLTSTSFNFDGIDDEIIVPYTDIDKRKRFKEEGFTFEFYGKVEGGEHTDKDVRGGQFRNPWV